MKEQEGGIELRGVPESTDASPEWVLEQPEIVLAPLTYTNDLIADPENYGKAIVRSSELSSVSAVLNGHLLLEHGGDHRVVIPSERINPRIASTGEFMVDTMRQVGVDESLMWTESPGRLGYTTTAEQVSQLAKMQRQGVFGEVPVVLSCYDFHSSRVRIHAEAFGLENFKVLSVEDIALRYAERFDADFAAQAEAVFRANQQVDRELEPALRALATVDPKGRVPTVLAKVRGARIDTLTENGDRLNTTAPKRIRELLETLK